MEHSMYRGGSRVDLTGMPRSSPGNTASFYPSPVTPTNGAARNDYFPMQQDDNLHRKVDQLLNIITSTQQVLVDQQAHNQRLESKVEKMSEDLFNLKSEMDEFHNSSPPETTKTRVKIPSELSVRLYITRGLEKRRGHVDLLRSTNKIYVLMSMLAACPLTLLSNFSCGMVSHFSILYAMS